MKHSIWSSAQKSWRKNRFDFDITDSIFETMAQLLVRNLNPSLVRKLKLRAKKHGVSSEEEHRRILQWALDRPESDKPTLVGFLMANECAPEVELPVERNREHVTRTLEF